MVDRKPGRVSCRIEDVSLVTRKMLDLLHSRKYSDQLFQVEVYRASDDSGSEKRKKKSPLVFSRPHSYHGKSSTKLPDSKAKLPDSKPKPPLPPGKPSLTHGSVVSMTQQIASKLMACTATSATYQRPSSCSGGGFEYPSHTWRFQPTKVKPR